MSLLDSHLRVNEDTASVSTQPDCAHPGAVQPPQCRATPARSRCFPDTETKPPGECRAVCVWWADQRLSTVTISRRSRIKAGTSASSVKNCWYHSRSW